MDELGALVHWHFVALSELAAAASAQSQDGDLPARSTEGSIVHQIGSWELGVGNWGWINTSPNPISQIQLPLAVDLPEKLAPNRIPGGGAPIAHERVE